MRIRGKEKKQRVEDKAERLEKKRRNSRIRERAVT